MSDTGFVRNGIASTDSTENGRLNTRGKYQFWLYDDKGIRIRVLDDYSFFSYSRSCHGYGSIEIGFADHSDVRPRRDWRIEVWRRPSEDFKFRRECSFLIRKWRIYQRSSDGMLMIVYYGRSPIDILRRFGGYILSTDNDTQEQEDGYFEDYEYAWETSVGLGNIAEAMQKIANGDYTKMVGLFIFDIYPGYLGAASNGLESTSPEISHVNTFGRSALDVISELRDTSIAMNVVDTSQKKVYFDVVEVDNPFYSVPIGFGAPQRTYPGTTPSFSYQFQTFIGLRGHDRTGSTLVFSTENGNLAEPVLSFDALDEYNAVIVMNLSANVAAVRSTVNYDATPLNKNYLFISSSAGTKAQALSEARTAIKRNAAQKTISAVFLDTPGGPTQPRSLYGLDWDLGDLVNVRFSDFVGACEVAIVYVSMDESGRETVNGRNQIGE